MYNNEIENLLNIKIQTRPTGIFQDVVLKKYELCDDSAAIFLAFELPTGRIITKRYQKRNLIHFIEDVLTQLHRPVDNTVIRDLLNELVLDELPLAVQLDWIKVQKEDTDRVTYAPILDFRIANKYYK